MTLLVGTDVPSRAGINNAITTEIAAHASTTNPASQHYDSGWITLPLAANVSGSAEIPQYRRVGKMVSVRGRVAHSSGFPVGTTLVATLPAGFTPSRLTLWALGATLATINGRFWVDTAGNINVSPSAAVASSSSVSVAFTIMVD